jgi:hypothetical protein
VTQEFHFVVIHPSGSFYIVQGIILSITMSNEYHIKRSTTVVPIFLCLGQLTTLSPRPEVNPFHSSLWILRILLFGLSPVRLRMEIERQKNRQNTGIMNLPDDNRLSL